MCEMYLEAKRSDLFASYHRKIFIVYKNIARRSEAYAK